MEPRMLRWTSTGPGFAAVVLLLALVAACTGNADEDEGAVAVENARDTEAVAGSFVGSAPGTKVFVAVVAAPAGDGQSSRAIEVYVADGRRLSESFSGSASGNNFVAKAGDGDREATVRLRGGSAAGTVELLDGHTVSFEASAPPGSAGLYELTVSPDGALSGASPAGLGATGKMPLGEGGTGMLRLVDGTRIRFEIVRHAASELARLQAGRVRLIVLPDGRLKGAGMDQPSDAGDPAFFIRTASSAVP